MRQRFLKDVAEARSKHANELKKRLATRYHGMERAIAFNGVQDKVTTYCNVLIVGKDIFVRWRRWALFLQWRRCLC